MCFHVCPLVTVCSSAVRDALVRRRIGLSSFAQRLDRPRRLTFADCRRRDQLCALRSELPPCDLDAQPLPRLQSTGEARRREDESRQALSRSLPIQVRTDAGGVLSRWLRVYWALEPSEQARHDDWRWCRAPASSHATASPCRVRGLGRLAAFLRCEIPNGLLPVPRGKSTLQFPRTQSPPPASTESAPLSLAETAPGPQAPQCPIAPRCKMRR